MKKTNTACRWCTEDNRCKILIASVCRVRTCSFFEKKKVLVPKNEIVGAIDTHFNHCAEAEGVR